MPSAIQGTATAATIASLIKNPAALNPLDMATFYTPGPQGYTDYPALSV